MAPEAFATDRSYQSLKAGIVAGRYRAGAAFNLQRLADECGTSITPIRDALQRMVGERLLEVLPGGGFQLPLPSAAQLRDLYLWHELLVRQAFRTPATGPLVAATSIGVLRDDDTEGLVRATSDFFAVAAEASQNRELAAAVANASDRLSLARRREPSLIKAMAKELEVLLSLATTGPAAAVRAAVRDYHRRRVRRADRIALALRD